MLKWVKHWIQLSIVAGLLLLIVTPLEAFISPSQKVLNSVTYTKIEEGLLVRKTPKPNQYQIWEITDHEKSGFLGYHGDSLDFMIYQDIIRFVMEEIIEIQIREDFHFLSVPLDPSLKVQTKEDLFLIFTDDGNKELALSESTFPLNFSIWDNYNQFGLNSIEHYSKNETVKPLGYQRRLKWLFGDLGISLNQIESLFKTAHDALKHNTGVILQIFDQSTDPYAFSKRVAYPSYPNGYICRNVTVDEYFLDDHFEPPYPHELRLILNVNETLNPSNPLKMVRYTPNLSTSTFKSYQKKLRSKIKKLSYNKSKKSSYREKLLNVWGLQ